MQLRSPHPCVSVPIRSRRRRSLALACSAVALVALAGCGSSASDGESTKGDTPSFCAAIDQFVTATKAGDRTQMADILAGTLDGLPEEGHRHVEAYVLALRGAPANHAPDADGVTAASTQESFETYVADTCGEDALPSADTTTTSTTAAPDQTTTDGSTDGGGGADSTTGSGGSSGSSGSTGSGGSTGM